MQQNASEVYDWVVDDVIGAVQGVFQQEGIDSSVLQELRDSWSRRLREKDNGTLDPPPPPPPSEDVVELDQQQVLKHASSPYLTTTTQQITSTGLNPYPSIPQTHFRGNNQDYIAQFYSYPATGGSPALTMHHPHQHRGNYGSRRGFVAQPRGYSTWPQGTSGDTTISPVGQSPMLSNYSSFRHQSLGRGGPTDRRSINGMYSSLAAINERPIGTHPITSNATLLQPRSTPVRHLILPNTKPQFHVQPSPLVPQVTWSSAKRKELDVGDGAQISSSVKTARREPEAAQSIPQRDGSNDDGAVETALASVPVEDEESDDDVSLSDVDDDEDPTDCVNCLYGQYDKVSRIKNRWRCVLKHGIFSVNGQDYLFKQANGEFTF